MQAPITLSANMLSINSSSKKRPLASVSGRSNTNYMSIQRLQGLLLTACRSGGVSPILCTNQHQCLVLVFRLRIHHPHHRRSHLRTRLQILFKIIHVIRSKELVNIMCCYNYSCNCSNDGRIQSNFVFLSSSIFLENNSFNFAILINHYSCHSLLLIHI